MDTMGGSLCSPFPGFALHPLGHRAHLPLSIEGCGHLPVRIEMSRVVRRRPLLFHVTVTCYLLPPLSPAILVEASQVEGPAALQWHSVARGIHCTNGAPQAMNMGEGGGGGEDTRGTRLHFLVHFGDPSPHFCTQGHMSSSPHITRYTLVQSWLQNVSQAHDIMTRSAKSWVGYVSLLLGRPVATMVERLRAHFGISPPCCGSMQELSWLIQPIGPST